MVPDDAGSIDRFDIKTFGTARRADSGAGSRTMCRGGR
jgi:hypothetical protein